MQDADPELIRFVAELEFVQALANPEYLNYLATSGYFDKPEFMNFLRYLSYWKRPDYIVHIMYPQGLRFLDALADPSFIESLKHHKSVEMIKVQQGNTWIGHGRTQAEYESVIHQASMLYERIMAPHPRVPPTVPGMELPESIN